MSCRAALSVALAEDQEPTNVVNLARYFSEQRVLNDIERVARKTKLARARIEAYFKNAECHVELPSDVEWPS